MARAAGTCVGAVSRTEGIGAPRLAEHLPQPPLCIPAGQNPSPRGSAQSRGWSSSGGNSELNSFLPSHWQWEQCVLQHREVPLASRCSAAAWHHEAKAPPARQREGRRTGGHICGASAQGRAGGGQASSWGKRMQRVTEELQRSSPSPKGGVTELCCGLYVSPA